MSTEKIIPMTAEQVKDFYKQTLMATDKRLNRAEATQQTMPKAGTFARLDKGTYKDAVTGKETLFPVLVVIDKNGKEIGNVAVGTIKQQKATGKARKVTRETSEYNGKYFHAGASITNLIGANELEQVSNLIGKSFTTKELLDLAVPKVTIVNEKVVMYDTEAEAIQAIEAKTCYQFNISE